MKKTKQYRIRFYHDHGEYHLQEKLKNWFFSFWWSLESSHDLSEMEELYKQLTENNSI